MVINSHIYSYPKGCGGLEASQFSVILFVLRQFRSHVGNLQKFLSTSISTSSRLVYNSTVVMQHDSMLPNGLQPASFFLDMNFNPALPLFDGCILLWVCFYISSVLQIPLQWCETSPSCLRGWPIEMFPPFFKVVISCSISAILQNTPSFGARSRNDLG